jgi:hypothetical protein
MKTKLLIAIVAGIGFAHAAPPVPTAAAGSIPEWLDTDGDGAISELERQAFVESRKGAAEALASQWDANDDGVIDDGERADAVAALQAKAKERIESLFLGIAGEDKVLTFEEFASLASFSEMPDTTVALLFGLLDTDKDGSVTLDEFTGVVGGGVTPPGRPSAP